MELRTFAVISTLLATLFSSVLASPTPSAPRADESTTPSDVDILNYLLTLEHLENAFFSSGLAQFSEDDFAAAGYPSSVRGRFEQIAAHEVTHVQFLTNILGSKAVGPCTYQFPPLTSPQSFVNHSVDFGGVASSAYMGSAKLIQNKSYLTDFTSILAAESKETSWISASVIDIQPWNGPFDIPLTPSGAFTIPQPFFQSCPPGSPPAFVKQFPALTVSNTFPTPGSSISLQYGQKTNGTGYAAWLDGLNVTYSAIDAQGETTVPTDLLGVVYMAVVPKKEYPTDENMLSGFALIRFPFGPDVSDT